MSAAIRIIKKVNGGIVSNLPSPQPKILVSNIIAKYASSENILSPGWTTFAGFAVDNTTEDTVVVTDNGSLRVGLDENHPIGTVFRLTLDIAAQGLGGSSLILAMVTDWGLSSNMEISITPGATVGRYSVLIDSTAGIGTVIRSAAVIWNNGAAAGTLTVGRVTVENVTGLASQLPSTYIPNSVSVQLNSYLHQASSIDPGISIAGGACALMDNDGWCWGTNGLWSIAANQMIPGGGGRSLHSRQAPTPGKIYDYRIACSNVGAEAAFSAAVAGVSLPPLTDAGSPFTGRVTAIAVNELTTFSSSLATGSGILDGVSVVEIDPDTLLDGKYLRDTAYDLAVDPITYLVTE